MRYIMVTIHDADFYFEMERIAKIIQTESITHSDTIDLAGIKETVCDMLVDAERTKQLSYDSDITFDEEYYTDYFTPTVKIMDESELREYGDGDIWYIPITDDKSAKILVV